MAGFTFEQNDTNTILLTVLRLSNTIPAFPADYSIPEVRISHVNGGAEVEDLAFTQMGQLSSSNRWFHKFNIPGAAQFTKFLVTFKTVIEGVETIAAEEFKVVPVSGFTAGGGQFAVTITVKNAITSQPIPNATVRIFDKSNPSVAIATTFTDNSGEATIFLDAGNYLIEFSKTGVIAEVHDLIVFANGTHNVVGS